MADKQPRSGGPDVDPTRGGSGRAGGSLAGEPVDDRVTLDDIQKFLHGLQYPASGVEAVEYARKRHAPLAVLDRLEWVAAEQFSSAGELNQALRKVEQTLDQGSR